MRSGRAQDIVAITSLASYSALAAAYAALVDGGVKAFGLALGVFVTVRLLFGLVEGCGRWLAWRLHDRNLIIGRYVRILRSQQFPRKRYSHDDFLTYLSRIQNEESYPESMRALAIELEFELTVFEEAGIVRGARMHAASDAALEIYSPSAEAPEFGAHEA